jgi:hypothetical protein
VLAASFISAIALHGTTTQKTAIFEQFGDDKVIIYAKYAVSLRIYLKVFRKKMQLGENLTSDYQITHEPLQLNSSAVINLIHRWQFQMK